MLRGAEANLLNVNFFTINFNIDKKTPDLSISVNANTIRSIGDTKMPVGMEKIRVDDDSDGVLIFNTPNTKRLKEAKVSCLLDDDAETEDDEKYDGCDDDNDWAEDWDENDYGCDDDNDWAEDWDENDYDLISAADKNEVASTILRDGTQCQQIEDSLNPLEKKVYFYDQIIKYTQSYLQPGDGYVWVKVGDVRVDGDEFHTPNYSTIRVDSLGNFVSIEYNWISATSGHKVMFERQIRRRISP